MQNYSIQICVWKNCEAKLSSIRREVFINEQSVPEELEWDEYDEAAQHVLAVSSVNEAIGTGRIKADGHIGRMAVLKSYRQQGIGSAILIVLLEIAQQHNLDSVYLHAQVSAVPFYEKHGFIARGEEFMDAGIPHKTMYKNFN